MSKLKQGFLPGFPEGALRIGDRLSILEKCGQVTYFVGGDNYFSHSTTDEQSKRYVLATLMDNGHVRARDLSAPPLNIPHRTLMNWVAQLRKEGASSFYRAAKQAKPRVMTSAMSSECARLLGEGKSPAEVARQKGIEESQGIVAPKKKRRRRRRTAHRQQQERTQPCRRTHGRSRWSAPCKGTVFQGVKVPSGNFRSGR